MDTRQELRQLDGQRFRCAAVVERFGTMAGYRGPVQTILLKEVIEAGTRRKLTDHLWFRAGKWTMELRPGDVVEFDARVGDYEKGYKGRREVYDAPVRRDWRLERPTKIVVTRVEEQNLVGAEAR